MWQHTVNQNNIFINILKPPLSAGNHNTHPLTKTVTSPTHSTTQYAMQAYQTVGIHTIGFVLLQL